LVLHAERTGGDIDCFVGNATNAEFLKTRALFSAPELRPETQDIFFGPGDLVSRLITNHENERIVVKWNEIVHPQWGGNAAGDDAMFERYTRFVLAWTAAKLNIVRMTRVASTRLSSEEVDRQLRVRIGYGVGDDRFWRPERWQGEEK
jgi:hypothetical protein